MFRKRWHKSSALCFRKSPLLLQSHFKHSPACFIRAHTNLQWGLSNHLQSCCLRVFSGFLWCNEIPVTKLNTTGLNVCSKSNTALVCSGGRSCHRVPQLLRCVTVPGRARLGDGSCCPWCEQGSPLSLPRALSAAQGYLCAERAPEKR